MRIGITTSATFTSKTYVAGATKANMSGAITGDTPEAFVEALHDVNDNHAKDDIESALDYISDAKREFVKELKYQLSNLEYLEPEIIDFCPRYDVCRDAAKVIAAGYDCVKVTSRMYLNVTLDTKLECTTQYYADELGKLLMAIKNDIEDVVNYIETQYHISIEYAVDIA